MSRQYREHIDRDPPSEDDGPQAGDGSGYDDTGLVDAPDGSGYALHWTMREAEAADDVSPRKCAHGIPSNVYCERCET